MDKKLINSLNKKQYSAIVKSTEYKQLLTQMCKRIVAAAKIAPNEATIESNFDCELFTFFRNRFEPIGFKYSPTKEQAVKTKRHITKGRADTVVGTLIIEFKQPSTLSSAKMQEDAVAQLTEYLQGMKNENSTSLVGLITDGVKACFLTNTNGIIHKESFQEISFEVLDRIIKNIVSLSLIALNSKNLVDNFCNNNGVAFELFKALYLALGKMTNKTEMLYQEWKELFNLAHDDISKQQAIIDRRTSLEKLAEEQFTDKDQEYKALFALQTAYAILVKIVAFRVVSQIRYNRTLIDFESLKKQTSDALRMKLVRLEDGEIFRDYGINNLFEGDFFSWYCSKEQWTIKIAEKITDVFSILSMYAEKAVLNKVERSQDFFKSLYEAMMPATVRHSLGEYYTKKWLAKNTVDEAIELSNVKNWRGLDPCCGSGTFITVMIDKVLQQLKNQEKSIVLDSVLKRVKGIDLNPIAVLTARVNYFINISHLLNDSQEIEIPIYLGDSSYVPQKIKYDNVNCLEYSISTLQKPINIIVPESMIRNLTKFSKIMAKIESHIKNLDVNSAFEILLTLVNNLDKTEGIKNKLHELAKELVELERKNWDGIWARIITNFLTTANLGKFDVIVGNPPWVDWKNLPSGYREKIKSFCISRKIFSGDKLVGGINLNICALIANVSAENWLDQEGVLAFLMPEPLVFQPSYEGFRNLLLSDNRKLYFRKFINWTKAGHPFKPITQKFLTFVISYKPQDYSSGIDTDFYVLKKGKNIESLEEFEESKLTDFFIKSTKLMATCHSNKNVFSYIDNHNQLQSFKNVAGTSSYLGREGIEFYPQELMIFTPSGLTNTKDCTALKNIQVEKSKYKVPQQETLLETEFLHPLIKGVDIKPFNVRISDYIVPFPYDKKNPKYPINVVELTKRAPRLASFYQKHKDLILAQTGYNERIIGNKGEFYALARVGIYSYAENHVVFRDNTKWGAAVVSSIDTPWGGKKKPLFQNHAVSICEDVNGNFISLDEAHYICGILNSPIATQYILHSSDSRSFPIRPRISIPKYDCKNLLHLKIAELSKKAHNCYDNKSVIDSILLELNNAYSFISKN